MSDPNVYPAWIDARTEISDAHAISFVKFKLSIPFSNFKSRDRLWITDDDILITYICDPRDIAQNARRVRNAKVKFPLSKIIAVSMTQQKDISIITIECNTVITTTQRQKLGKILFFYFRDADKAVELKNIIRSNSNNIRLTSSPATSDDGSGTANPKFSQNTTQIGNTDSIHPGANGSTTKSVKVSEEAPQVIAPESDKGDDDDDDRTLVLPFGTQIPRKRSASLPTSTQHQIPAIFKVERKVSPQPDYEDDVQDLLKYEEIRDLQATVEGIAIRAGKNLVKEQKRSHKAQKELHTSFWQKVRAGKKESEKELHTVDKSLLDRVPSMVQKTTAFQQTLRNGFTTFPNITQAINRAIKMVESSSSSLANLRPTFDD